MHSFPTYFILMSPTCFLTEQKFSVLWTGHGRNACGLQTFVADWFYLCELSMVCCSFVEKNVSPQEKVWLLGFTCLILTQNDWDLGVKLASRSTHIQKT